MAKQPGKPEQNALWKKYIRPSSKRSAPIKSPQRDLWDNDNGNNITRPRFDPKNPYKQKY